MSKLIASKFISQLWICISKWQLDMSTWISFRNLKLNITKTELFLSPHPSPNQHGLFSVFILANDASTHPENSKSLASCCDQPITEPCQSSQQMTKLDYLSLHLYFLHHLSSEMFLLSVLCNSNSFLHIPIIS